MQCHSRPFRREDPSRIRPPIWRLFAVYANAMVGESGMGNDAINDRHLKLQAAAKRALRACHGVGFRWGRSRGKLGSEDLRPADLLSRRLVATAPERRYLGRGARMGLGHRQVVKPGRDRGDVVGTWAAASLAADCRIGGLGSEPMLYLM
jgi:hypothetical protein